jgi:hypothetical protein
VSRRGARRGGGPSFCPVVLSVLPWAEGEPLEQGEGESAIAVDAPAGGLGVVVTGADVDAVDAILRLLGTEPDYADAVLHGDLDNPAIPAEIRVLAELAVEITQHAYRITDDDLDRVRAHGWTDPQLIEAVWVACQFNATVRLADTFGLRDLNQLEAANIASGQTQQGHDALDCVAD